MVTLRQRLQTVLAAIGSLYAGGEGLSVPGTVFDGRFGEPVTLNVE